MSLPAVGNIDSNAKGTGARYTAGKPPVELLLWRPVARAFSGSAPEDVRNAMDCLGWFQETHETAYLRDLIHNLYAGDFRQAMVEAAQVFAFGAKKYKAWNWAKGMAWSVPLACIGRHLMAIASGEDNDTESMLPHRGHVVCNVLMLLAYANVYPEGNDLPTLWVQPEVKLIAADPAPTVRPEGVYPCHAHDKRVHCDTVIPGHGHPCKEESVLSTRLIAYHFDRMS